MLHHLPAQLNDPIFALHFGQHSYNTQNTCDQSACICIALHLHVNICKLLQPIIAYTARKYGQNIKIQDVVNMMKLTLDQNIKIQDVVNMMKLTLDQNLVYQNYARIRPQSLTHIPKG